MELHKNFAAIGHEFLRAKWMRFAGKPFTRDVASFVNHVPAHTGFEKRVDKFNFDQVEKAEREFVADRLVLTAPERRGGIFFFARFEAVSFQPTPNAAR